MITLTDELPDELDGGGIALARSMTNEPTVELLQSVIFPRLLLCDSRDDGRFTFISTDLRLKPELTVARALLAEMTEFLIGMFRVDPATRICVALTDDPFNGFGAPGALIPIRADWLGLGSNGDRYEHLIVRMLTGMWWGSGCRIRGEDSLPIYIAIGAAMGLLWLESRGVQDAVERLLAKHRTGPQGEATSNMTGALQVSALTVAFHRALREPRVAREFGRMTREYWAQSVSEEVWLRRLNACGIDLPDVLLGG
jgi:hypothetical protein